MSAKTYIVVCEDRHVDPEITVHRTRAGADRAVDRFMASYGGRYEWREGDEDGNVPGDWLRYVSTDMPEDGPSARIETGRLHR